MFKLNKNYEVDRKILKCVYTRYSVAEVTKTNTPNSQIYINITGEDSVISLLNSYLELNSEVIKKADNNRYGDGKVIRLVNIGPIAFFRNFKLTTSSRKYLEVNSHAEIVSLLYILRPSSRGSDDLSIGFDRDRKKRRDELTRKKNTKGKYNLRIMLKVVLDFA